MSNISTTSSENSISSPSVHVGGRRIIALFLDLVVLSCLEMWISTILGIPIPIFQAFTISIPPITPRADLLTVSWYWQLLLVVVYFLVQEALYGATIGKRIMGLRVVDTHGQHATFSAVLLRNILRLIDALPVLSISFGIVLNIPYIIGGIVAFISPYRQRLGDRVAGTLVVDVRSVPFAPRLPTEIRARVIGLVTFSVIVLLWLGTAYFTQPPLVIEGLRNTHNSLFGQHAFGHTRYGQDIASYTLGSPSWGIGTVTYAIQYKLVGDTPPHCSGTITLRWVILGWTPYHGQYQCGDFGGGFSNG